MKKTFVLLVSSKHIENATGEHCNKDITKKKEKKQTSSLFWLLLSPLPSPKNDEKNCSNYNHSGT
jgi:hypothetical protein